MTRDKTRAKRQDKRQETRDETDLVVLDVGYAKGFVGDDFV